MTDLPILSKDMEELRDPFLTALGDRLRILRARRGFSRKALAQMADVSERHVANVETGVGNATLQFLRQLAAVLNCSLGEMIGDETSSSPEWIMIRELMRGRSDAELAKARTTLAGVFDSPVSEATRRERVALIGLRGAGKSGLGRMLADYWMVPFIELSRYIEKVARCSVPEIHALYGPSAYRRYELRALEEIVQQCPRAVIATPGGIVSEPATFNFLLSHCYTVWLKASPRDHMERVLAQGDTRPMAGNRQAMQDLSSILESRAAFYSKADQTFDTSEMTHEMAFHGLVDRLSVLTKLRQ